MKRIYFLFVLNVCTGFIIAQSPISLSNANMPGSGDTLRFTNFTAGSAGNYMQTGANFNWDFSQVLSSTEGIRNFKSALQTPYALFFLSLNEYGEKISDTIGAGPLTLTNYYNFYKKQTTPVNAFIADGVGLTFSSVPIPSYYSDKDELYNFPMTYQRYDSTTFKFSTTTGGFIPFSYSKVGYRVTVVDGWGTVTTPYGTESCLRLVTTQYANDSIKNTIIPIPIGFANYQRSYQWMTLTSKIPFLEITGSLVGTNFTPTQTRYRGYDKRLSTGLKEAESSMGLQVYPNPVKDELWLQGPAADKASYGLYTADGRLVSLTSSRSASTGLPGTKAFIDVSGLSAGCYFLKVSAGGGETYIKFIKE